jgi:hypothetical protein
LDGIFSTISASILHSLRIVDGTLGQFAQCQHTGGHGFSDHRAHETSLQKRSPNGARFSRSGLDAGDAHGRVIAITAALAPIGAGFHLRNPLADG